MLDVGMTELLCFAIIAILVLGPEKLPEAARFAGRWYVRLNAILRICKTRLIRATSV